MMKKIILAILLITAVTTYFKTSSASDVNTWHKKKKNAIDLRNIKDVCNTPPILTRYVEAGLAKRTNKNTITLFLNADLHSADCGAPDCYGTYLEVRLNILPQGEHCILRSVYVMSENYVDCPEAKGHLTPEDLKIRDGAYRIESRKVDLNDQQLDKLTIRRKKGKEALIIKHNNFYYYENVTPHGLLREQLPSGERGEDESCCWGSTSSEVNFLQHQKEQH